MKFCLDIEPYPDDDIEPYPDDSTEDEIESYNDDNQETYDTHATKFQEIRKRLSSCPDKCTWRLSRQSTRIDQKVKWIIHSGYWIISLNMQQRRMFVI